MTLTGLPRRPYVEQTPPPDGLPTIQAAARGRRRRRALLVATGGGVAAAVSAAVALSIGTAGLAVLQPTPAVQPPQPIATAPAGQHRPSTHRHDAGSGSVATVQVGPIKGASGATSPDRQLASRAAAPAVAASKASPGVRLQVFQSRHVNDGAQICAGDIENGAGTSSSSGLGWCLFATAKNVSSGVQLTLTACRDDTSGGKLTYSTTREVDIAVKRGGRMVWNWAKDHPATPSPHTRSAAASNCWNWQLVWPDITQAGASAGHGRFTFVGTPMAKELAGTKPETIPFDY